MNRVKVLFTVVICVVFILFITNKVGECSSLSNGSEQFTVGTLIYLNYLDGEKDMKTYSDLKVTRAYLNVKMNVTPWFEARLTPDAHQDETGDYKVRLKYAYGKFRSDGISIKGSSLIAKPYMEVGLIHTPWFDWEEHVDYYRVRGKMFIERVGTMNSADFGIMFGGLLGGVIDQQYQTRVNKGYPGKYGSFAVGVYTGSGYHDSENNENKVVEGRITVRPLPNILPGFQLTYFGVRGKGNLSNEPDWTVDLGLLSYEQKYFVITAQYLSGKGTQKGYAVDNEDNPYNREGYSVFGEIKIPPFKSSVILIYDWFDPYTDDNKDRWSRYVIGWAYHLPRQSMVIAEYNIKSFEQDWKEDDTQFQLALQVHFP